MKSIVCLLPLILWLAYVQACSSARLECPQGFQPWDGGCVSNQRFIEEDLGR